MSKFQFTIELKESEIDDAADYFREIESIFQRIIDLTAYAFDTPVTSSNYTGGDPFD